MVKKDGLLSKVIDGLNVTPFQHCRHELSVPDGCLLWQNRVVIPPAGRQLAMDLFHQGHPGYSRMKGLARSYIWWPGIDKDLENRVKDCEDCQGVRNQPQVSPLVTWEVPQAPWERLHGYYAGPRKRNVFHFGGCLF